MVRRKGLIYIFTGEGKGKTSAALGVTLRTLLNEGKVIWVSWYKEPTWSISEMGLVDKWKKVGLGKLAMYWMGKGFYFKDEKEKREMKMKTVGKGGRVYDRVIYADHQAAALQALTMCEKCLKNKDVDLLVMDEVVNAINDGLLQEEDVLKVLAERGKAHLVLTGRGASPDLIKEADLVSEIRKIKHPFDKGELAIRGLDF